MDEFYNKHYIRLNSDNMIIKGFSTAFEKPLETDICINEKGGRHFEIDGVINPPLFDEKGCHLYRYDSDTETIRLATDEELDAEYESNYTEPEPTETELQWQAITDLEIAQMEYEQRLSSLEEVIE